VVEEKPVRIPLTIPYSGHHILKLGYYTGQSGEGTISVGDTRVPVTFRNGLHVLYVVVTGTYSYVEVSRAPNLKPLCVTDLEIGVPKR
jgi:hypothetical protein